MERSDRIDNVQISSVTDTIAKVGAYKSSYKTAPQLIYEGKCPFCACWASRLVRVLGFPGKFLPYDENFHNEFTGMSEDQFKEGVVLWDPNKGVFQGGSAVIRMFELSGKLKWVVYLYHRFQFVKRFIDASYCFVSEHRPILTRLTFCKGYP